jgi:Uma2 family endonuclease
MTQAAVRDRAAETRSRMSLPEFLGWDDGTDKRYELVRGEAIAMAPSLIAHGDLVVNLARHVSSALRPPCRATSEAGIVLPDRADTFYVADLVVSCVPRRAGERYFTEPRVIIEVLSESTAAHDRDVKLPDYRDVPSVEAILLVDSRKMRAELWHRRDAGGWLVQDLRAPEDEVVIEGLGLRLPLAAIYEGVALEASREAS